MKSINVSTKYIDRFAGRWVAIDHEKDKIIAVGKTLEEIGPFVSGTAKDAHKIKASAFKVPTKEEMRFHVHPMIF